MKGSTNISKLKKDILSKITINNDFKKNKISKFWEINQEKFGVLAFSLGVTMVSTVKLLGINVAPETVIYAQMVLFGISGYSFMEAYKILKSSNKTSNMIKEGDFSEIEGMIDDLMLKNGKYKLSKRENKTIIKLYHELINQLFDKNYLDNVYIQIKSELSDDELKTILNSDLILNFYENNIQIGGAINLYCLLLLSEQIIELRKEKVVDHVLYNELKGLNFSESEIFQSINYLKLNKRLKIERNKENKTDLDQILAHKSKIEKGLSKEVVFYQDYIEKLNVNNKKINNEIENKTILPKVKKEKMKHKEKIFI